MAVGVASPNAPATQTSKLLGEPKVQNLSNTAWDPAATVHVDAALMQGTSKEVAVKMHEIDSRSPGNIG